MKNFSLVLFGLFSFISLSAQIICDLPDNPASDLPPGCLLCGLEYSGSNENYTANPFDIAFPCGTIENSFFLHFYTDDSGKIEGELAVSDCSLNGGIQIAILDENLEPVSHCIYSDNPAIPAQINVENLEKNAKYIIMGDGFAGDVCNFRISISSGVRTDVSQLAASPIEMISANRSDPNLICQETEVCFSIDSIVGATSYFWETSDGQVTTPLDSNTICLNFGTLGTKTIRVSPLEGCAKGSASEIQFEVLQKPNSTYPTSPICRTSLPVEIDGFMFEEYGKFVKDFITSTCDSFVTYIVFPRNQPVIDIDSVVCKENPVTIGTEIFGESGKYQILIDPGSNILCDTVVNLDLTIANFEPPKIECLVDSFLNAVAFRWNEILLTEGYLIIVNGDTIKAQNFESFLYFPKESNEQIRLEVLPFNLTGCHFFSGFADCVGPTTVSTKEQNLNRQFSIVPNPSGGVFQLHSDLLIEKIEVFDFSGKPIFKTNKKSIDLSNEPTGIYFFKIKTKEGIAVKKVVKI